MTRNVTLLTSIGIGAALMYALDPAQGRRRRALVRDRAASASRRIQHAVRTGARDLGNRARGVRAEQEGAARGWDAPEDTITLRVREAIGRVVRHPGAVHVMVNDGVARLDGPVLAAEASALLAAARHVPGVRAIDDHLVVRYQAGHVPGLQGEGTAPRRSALRALRSPASRLVAAGGLGLAGVAYLVARSR